MASFEKLIIKINRLMTWVFFLEPEKLGIYKTGLIEDHFISNKDYRGSLAKP